MAFNEFLIGKRERMNWIVETSYGSGGTLSSGEVVGYNDEISIDEFSKGWQEILTAGNDTLQVENEVIGPKVLRYTHDFTPFNWRWLKYLMGVVDADDAGTKTHTFTVRNTILSHKLEWAKRHTTPHVLTLLGNVVKSATISFAKATGEGTEGLLKVSMDVVGRDISEGSSVASISLPTKDPFQYRMAKLTLASTEFKELNNGEMTIDLGITEDDSRYCNTTFDSLLGEPIPKIFRVTGTFNITIKDATIYDQWDSNVVLSGTNTLLFDKDGTGNDQILFTFDSIRVKGGVASTNIEGTTTVDIVFTAQGFTSVVARDNITTY